MGKILNGILGGVKGKVAGVVGANWKGIDYLRGYAIPSNPNTVPQQAQRNKFSAIIAFAKTILATIIQEYWDPFASGESGFNAFSRRNLLDWSDLDDIASAMVSQGNLESLPVDGCTYSDSGLGPCNFAWSLTGLGDGADTDKVVMLVHDFANNVSFVSDAVETRDAEGGSVDVGTGRTPANLKAFLFFYRGTGETLYVSDSSYFQVVAA